jgi:hypothetical protein
VGIALRATAVWFLMIFAESLNGALRNLAIAPLTGDFAARQVGVLTGSLIIIGIAYLALPWLGAKSQGALLAVGVLWLVLMASFEVGVGRLLGRSWEQIGADYAIWRGGLLPFGLLALTFAPLIAAKLRHRKLSRAKSAG